MQFLQRALQQAQPAYHDGSLKESIINKMLTIQPYVTLDHRAFNVCITCRGALLAIWAAQAALLAFVLKLKISHVALERGGVLPLRPAAYQVFT